MDKSQLTDQHKAFIGLRKDYILMNDGDRIVLYPLDILDSRFFTLKPIQGFALSLINGNRKFEDIESEFKWFFPQSKSTLWDIVSDIEKIVKKNQLDSHEEGIDGLLLQSDQPIDYSQVYNPKEFIVPQDRFQRVMSDIRTKWRLNIPINFLAFFSNRCQTDCKYCYMDKDIDGPLITLERWKEIIKELKQLGISRIMIDGSEPLCRPDGIDLLEELIKAEMLFMLSTKAYFSQEDVSRLVAAGFKKKINHHRSRVLQLSIDAWDDKKLLYLTGSSMFKENIKKTFKNFIKAGIKPKIKSVITPMNSDEPIKIVEYFYPRGVRIFNFLKYFRSFYRHRDEFFQNDESNKILLSQINEIRSRYPDATIFEDVGDIGRISGDIDLHLKKETAWENRAGCSGGWSTVGAAANGGAVLCEMMRQSKPFFVGDFTTQPILEVWNGKKMLDFIYPPKEKFRNTVCYLCNEFDACHWIKGYCYRNAYFSYGTIYEAPPACPKQNKPGLRLI